MWRDRGWRCVAKFQSPTQFYSPSSDTGLKTRNPPFDATNAMSDERCRSYADTWPRGRETVDATIPSDNIPQYFLE